MAREHKKELRTMKDGKTIALDTMSGLELLQSADLCLKNGVGNQKYKDKVQGIVSDATAVGGKNFYVTLTMRRVLMGFIRPVFEEEWRRRQSNKLEAPKLTLDIPKLKLQ